MLSRLNPFTEEKKTDEPSIPSFLSSPLGQSVAAIIEAHSTKIHDDSFLKIIRQLQFWHEQSLPDDQFLALTERLCKIALWREDASNSENKFTIPKVRFGKTEVRIPIVTCGGMRVQETWIPDTVPLIKPNKSRVVKSASQSNLKDVILNCLRVGLNHFETARFYGSSEVQFVAALGELVEDGTIKREVSQRYCVSCRTSTDRRNIQEAVLTLIHISFVVRMDAGLYFSDKVVSVGEEG